MSYRVLLLFTASMIFFSCKKEKQTIDLPAPPPPSTVYIKDVLIDRLPSPFYHFEYNAAGKVSFISYASDFFRYDVSYEGEKIIEMKNNILVNKDRLQYFYDDAGRVDTVKYINSMGLVYTIINLEYNGSKLIKLDRERKIGADFVIDKTITLTYYADGNLQDRTVHYPAIVGQPELTFVDRYEQYDNRINAEGFSLLHEDDFFDHFVFLPLVQLQKNNPGRQVRTGDGGNFRIDYSYTYDNRDAPLTKSGDFVYTSGPSTGQRFLLTTNYTYYP